MRQSAHAEDPDETIRGTMMILVAGTTTLEEVAATQEDLVDQEDQAGLVGQVDLMGQGVQVVPPTQDEVLAETEAREDPEDPAVPEAQGDRDTALHQPQDTVIITRMQSIKRFSNGSLFCRRTLPKRRSVP